MILSQYKQNGKIAIAINNKDIWKSAGTYNFEFNEKLEFVRSYDFALQDAEAVSVETTIPMMALIRGSGSHNIAFFKNDEEFISTLLSGDVVKLFYYGRIGEVYGCRWKLENVGSTAICRISLEGDITNISVLMGQFEVDSESDESIIVNQGISYKTGELPSELKGSDIVLNQAITIGEEFETEKRKLGTVVFAIKGKISEIEAKSDYVDRYATISGGDDGTEFAQLQHKKHVSQKDYEKIDWLNDRANIPYKYRVDHKDNGTVHKYYLGPVGISEEDLGRGNQVISYFSDEGKRLATYNPNNKKLNSEISLRREFNIKKSVLHDYRNIVGTVTVESSEFREGLYDPFLIDIFKKRRESREIKDIVLSIQDNQNSIVDVSGDECVVVQGCAGSGKTMVMMHRLSKLLNWDSAFDAREVVVIGPSKQYKSYMRNVVEGLAISSITQSTIEEYYNDLISEIDKDFATKSIIRSESDVNEAFLGYIYSSDYLDRMDMYIKNIADQHERFKSEFKSFLIRIGEEEKYELDVPIYQFYDCIIRIVDELKEKNDGHDKQIDQLKERIKNLEQRKAELESGSIDVAKKEYIDFVNATVDKVKERLKDSDQINVRELVEHGGGNSLDSQMLFLFKIARIDPETEKDLMACERKEGDVQELEKELRGKPVLIENEQRRLEELIRNNKSKDNGNEIDSIKMRAEKYRNTRLYTAMFDEITREVLAEQNIKKPKGIHRYDLYSRLQFCIKFFKQLPSMHRFMFIDEGQDYSYMEYKLLSALGNNKTVFNIFGDIQQVTNHGHGMSDWRSLKELFSFKMFYLEENYRNSNQITRYCNNKFSLSMKEIGINSAEVKEISKDEFEYEIVTDSKPQDERWIILLDRSVDKKKFIKALPTNRLTSDQIGSSDISVMYVDEIKGFEFDRVYAVSSNMNDNMKYVAYTRALNELLVVNW